MCNAVKKVMEYGVFNQEDVGLELDFPGRVGLRDSITIGVPVGRHGGARTKAYSWESMQQKLL